MAERETVAVEPQDLAEEYIPIRLCEGRRCHHFIRHGGTKGRIKGLSNCGKCRRQNNLIVYANSSLCPL